MFTKEILKNKLLNPKNNKSYKKYVSKKIRMWCMLDILNKYYATRKEYSYIHIQKETGTESDIIVSNIKYPGRTDDSRFKYVNKPDPNIDYVKMSKKIISRIKTCTKEKKQMFFTPIKNCFFIGNKRYCRKVVLIIMLNKGIATLIDPKGFSWKTARIEQSLKFALHKILGLRLVHTHLTCNPSTVKRVSDEAYCVASNVLRVSKIIEQLPVSYSDDEVKRLINLVDSYKIRKK